MGKLRRRGTFAASPQMLRRKTRLMEGEARDEGASAELSDMRRRGSSDARSDMRRRGSSDAR